MRTLRLLPLAESVEVTTQSTLLEALLARHCQVAVACGGQGICATCHVHVKEGEEALTPPTSRELRTLSLMTGATASSRLACQACVVGDGLVVELPEGMYLQHAEDLTSLVGRRAQAPILHPADGRVLIAKGKIITRSRILELQDEDLQVMQLRDLTGDARLRGDP